MSDKELRHIKDPALRMELAGLKEDRRQALRCGDVALAHELMEAIREVRREARNA